MRKFLSCLSIAALTCGTLIVGLASIAQAHNCQKAAVEKLRALAPDGYAIYQEMKDKKFFDLWIDCSDGQFGLPSAVHESVHFLTADKDAFPLVGGDEIMRPHEVSLFFAPSHIAGKFKKNDFVDTYLRPGRASSSADFMYLLDELNAYTHDLNAAIDLKDLRRSDQYTDNRDGLAAVMAFVALYAEKAKLSEPATWSGLQKPEVAKTLSQMWGRAETVMQSSCGIADFGTQDKMFIGKFCQPDAQSALETIIGRAPVCPTACLKSDSDAAASAQTIDDASVPLDLKSRTFWSRRTNRRVSPAPEANEDATTE